MKSTEELLRDGKQIKEYRKLMGLKQYEMAKELNTEQSCYSRMEQGKLNADWRVDVMRKRFIAWRVSEIERLKKKIDYLNAL